MRRPPLQSVIVLVGLLLGLVACQPTVTPTPLPLPTPTSSNGFGITATSMGGAAFPAGTSNSFTLNLVYPVDQTPQTVDWRTQNVASGLTPTMVGGTTPWQRRLLVSTDPALAAGSYTLDIVAMVNANLSVQATLNVTITACAQTASGTTTELINLNLVELITAGKPNVEHGLLVPVQICGAQRHIHINLTKAIAQDGSTLTTLPPFYIFRSEVWPAPNQITAHGLTELFNVQVPLIAQGNAGQLIADVPPGLYLLIFERDRFGATLTPDSTPASVTWDLTIT